MDLHSQDLHSYGFADMACVVLCSYVRCKFGLIVVDCAGMAYVVMAYIVEMAYAALTCRYGLYSHGHIAMACTVLSV